MLAEILNSLDLIEKSSKVNAGIKLLFLERAISDNPRTFNRKLAGLFLSATQFEYYKADAEMVTLYDAFKVLNKHQKETAHYIQKSINSIKETAHSIKLEAQIKYQLEREEWVYRSLYWPERDRFFFSPTIRYFHGNPDQLLYYVKHFNIKLEDLLTYWSSLSSSFLYITRHRTKEINNLMNLFSISFRDLSDLSTTKLLALAVGYDQLKLLVDNNQLHYEQIKEKTTDDITYLLKRPMQKI